MRTPDLLEESNRIGPADSMPDYCPEYYHYYIMKNLLCFCWIISLFIGLYSYKKRSTSLILTFIILNSIAIIYKAVLEVTITLQNGPCLSVVRELAEEWDLEGVFESKFMGAIFKYEISQWNTFTMLLSGIIAQFCSLFLRKKAFAYDKLEPSTSFTVN